MIKGNSERTPTVFLVDTVLNCALRYIYPCPIFDGIKEKLLYNSNLKNIYFDF
jgi:hypothetical protein